MGNDICCFCFLCGRDPPDPNYKFWLETRYGCVCEKCWKDLVEVALEEKIKTLSK